MTTLLDTSTRVQTPELIAFEFRLAGPWRRALAYGIDLGIRVVAFIIFAAGLAFASSVSPMDELASAPMALLLLLYFLTEWFYFVLFEWLWDGRTPGKKALGLRVVKEGGLPLGAPGAFLRNLLRAADLMPPIGMMPSYLVGGLVSGADRKFRRLGDLAAGTLVIVEESYRPKEPAPIEPPPTRAEMALIPGQLRLKVEEKKTIDAFMRRWRALHPARREELCEPYALALARRLGVAAPASKARFLQLVYARMNEQSAQAPRPR